MKKTMGVEFRVSAQGNERENHEGGGDEGEERGPEYL